MDIGANEAKWSIKTKNIYADAKFCLIEPQVEMEHLLKSSCNTTPGSVYFLAGAGAATEKKYLTVWDDLQGSSFLPKEDNNLKTKGKQREIEMVTVNKIIADKRFDVPNLVKIDVQGFELEALKGADQFLEKLRRLL